MSSAGQGSISFSQRNEQGLPPGPPFVPTSAYNGVSVDTVTGQIVLGDDPGGILGQLVNNREIQMNFANLSFLNGNLLSINSSGNRLAGFTNSNFVIGYASGLPATVQVNQPGGNWGLALCRPTTDANGANFTFYKTRGGNVASVVGALLDADVMGNINWQGVSQNGTIRNSHQLIARAITDNTSGAWGTGLVPVGSVASLFDLVQTNIAGVLKNRLRLFPNGEWSLTDVTVGGFVPHLDGMMFQVYGTAGIENSLNVGAIATNNALAVLELTSTTKGFLPARMTAVQGTALAVGAAEDGLQIHVTTVNATFPAVGPYWWNNALGLWVAM